MVELLTTISESIVYVVIPSLFVVLWYFKEWKRRRCNRLTTGMTEFSGYPIIGPIFYFLGTSQHISEKLIKLINKYGLIPFKTWMVFSLFVVIAHPKDLQIVLNNSKCLDKGPFHDFFKRVAGEGLFSASVDQWRKNRRLITPAFHSTILEQFFPLFFKKSKLLVENLKKELGKTQPFDLWPDISYLTFNLICQTAIDHNIDSRSNSATEFHNAIKKTVELDFLRILKPWLHPDVAFSIYLKLTGQQKFYDIAKKLPLQIVKDKKKEFKQKKKLKKDSIINDSIEENKRFKVFIDILLELNEQGENFTDEQLRDEIVTMLVAGSETSAVTVCFCLLILAIHPDIQDKAYDEIDSVLGDSNEIITFNEITKLEYLEQVIKETLRLFPTVPVIQRQILDDIKISNHILPKGTICVLAIYGTHHSPEIYPNPDAFNPENFNKENVSQRHKYSSISFSGGPRSCIGANYAMWSMKVILTVFLQNYSVHTDVKLCDIKLKTDVLLRSVNGFPVTIRPRIRRPVK